MSAEYDPTLDCKKAMAYDLLRLLENDQTYTKKDLEQIIRAYIAGLSQK